MIILQMDLQSRTQLGIRDRRGWSKKKTKTWRENTINNNESYYYTIFISETSLQLAFIFNQKCMHSLHIVTTTAATAAAAVAVYCMLMMPVVFKTHSIKCCFIVTMLNTHDVNTVHTKWMSANFSCLIFYWNPFWVVHHFEILFVGTIYTQRSIAFFRYEIFIPWVSETWQKAFGWTGCRSYVCCISARQKTYPKFR